MKTLQLLLIALLLTATSFAQETIPFKFVKNMPVAVVEINGVKARVLLDTGAERNLLNTEYMDFLHLTKKESESEFVVTGVTGTTDVVMLSKHKITHNGVVISKGIKFAVNLRPMRRELGVVGLLGMEFLKDYIIDFKNKRIIKIGDNIEIDLNK